MLLDGHYYCGNFEQKNRNSIYINSYTKHYRCLFTHYFYILRENNILWSTT